MDINGDTDEPKLKKRRKLKKIINSNWIASGYLKQYNETMSKMNDNVSIINFYQERQDKYLFDTICQETVEKNRRSLMMSSDDDGDDNNDNNDDDETTDDETNKTNETNAANEKNQK